MESTDKKIKDLVQSSVAPLANLLYEVKTNTKENTQTHRDDMEKILHAFTEHAEKDDIRFTEIGDTIVNMKGKVDEMHALLVQAKAVGGFFGGIKSIAGWLLVIGALVALFKGWLIGLLAYFITK